jgi:hypothetical protein
MAEFVNSFFERALLEALLMGRVSPKLGVQACQSDKCAWATRPSLSKEKVEARGEQVEVGDTQYPLGMRATTR